MCSETPALSSTSSFSSAWSCSQAIADPRKCSLPPSGKVWRRNPDPELPITSRQSGKVGHRLLVQEGTSQKGHWALSCSGSAGYPHLCARLESGNPWIIHLPTSLASSRTSRVNSRLPDILSCPRKLQGCFSQEDVDAGRHLLDTWLLPQKTLGLHSPTVTQNTQRCHTTKLL